MRHRIIDNPNHWRERAEEARALAEQLNRPESKRTMLRIADAYERWAEHAQRRAEKRPPSTTIPGK